MSERVYATGFLASKAVFDASDRQRMLHELHINSHRSDSNCVLLSATRNRFSDSIVSVNGGYSVYTPNVIPAKARPLQKGDLRRARAGRGLPLQSRSSPFPSTLGFPVPYRITGMRWRMTGSGRGWRLFICASCLRSATLYVSAV